MVDCTGGATADASPVLHPPEKEKRKRKEMLLVARERDFTKGSMCEWGEEVAEH